MKRDANRGDRMVKRQAQTRRTKQRVARHGVEKLNNASVMKRAEIIAMLASRFMVDIADFEWNAKIDKALSNARLVLEGAIAEAQKMKKIS